MDEKIKDNFIGLITRSKEQIVDSDTVAGNLEFYDEDGLTVLTVEFMPDSNVARFNFVFEQNECYDIELNEKAISEFSNLMAV